jgi:CheY-like chemotaxis protein
MDEKPLIVALADEEGLRHYYEEVAHELGISCRAFAHAEEVPADFKDARMAILNSRALPYVSNFSGSKIMITGGDVAADHMDYCVNEIWQNPVPIKTLQGLMRKCTSDKPRVLLVEDEGGVAKLLKQAFHDMGFEVEHFSNADEAVPFIPSVHYVLCDVCQPEGMGGFGLLAEVRKIYDGAQLPFVLMSGKYIEPRLMPPAAQAFLQKPFNVSEFESVVNSIFSQRIPKV